MMTEQEKELLLKVLCEMLPYGIMCRIDHDPEGEYDIEIDDERFVDDRIVSVCPESEQIFVYDDEDYPYSPEEIRPYLRPMSSMTEKEKSKLRQWGCLCMNLDDSVEDIGVYGAIHSIPIIDYLNSIHVDDRGLIPMGLALEAKEGMYA